MQYSEETVANRMTGAFTKEQQAQIKRIFDSHEEAKAPIDI